MSAEHWLSYTHADQEVLRADTQRQLWSSLVVPATIATYQPTGTSAYVRSLQSPELTPFIIDPRTPLLQPSDIEAAAPRASHLSVADLHHPDAGALLRSGASVEADWWTAERWKAAVDRVLDFEERFEQLASPAATRYQQMLEGLGESLQPRAPRFYVGPYFAIDDLASRWWELSLNSIAQTAKRRPNQTLAILCLRRKAHPQRFQEMIAALPEGVPYAACWWGRWDEAKAEAWHVDAWLAAAAAGRERGIKVINFYGGGLTALMCGLGLDGLNHGVGYSESRDERRLTETGAPPMRYYMPGLRFFLGVPDAQQATNEVVDTLGPEHRCPCSICERNNWNLLKLSNDELKAHFLTIRAIELRDAQSDIAAEVDAVEALGNKLVETFVVDPDEDEDAISNTERILAQRGGVLLGWASFLRPHVP